jgi:plastin-1
VLQALQSRGESYDRARETLKHVSVDASGKVELEDWVEVRSDFYTLHSPVSSRYSHPTIYTIPIGQLNVKLRSQTSSITTRAGKVTVQGSNANVSHTINEDERREFTNHINGVSIPHLRDVCAAR